jgi:pyrroloquinoline quinone biosynthesis protein E
METETTRSAQLRALPAPEPAAGLEAYSRERELALALSPRKRDNFVKYSRSARRRAQVDYLPIKLDIENVSRCNFRCTMCVVSDWVKGKRAADMPLAEFKRLIDEQYGLLEIKLQGIGEPIMQGDDFFEMIRYARAQHIWVRTTTNASLLHLRDNYKKLVDTDVNEIQISIDGADKEVFETVRRGSQFERVVANCQLINAYCKEKGVVRTKMWTVVQKANRHQLEQLVHLARELGFTNQVFSLELTNWGLEKWSVRNGEVTVEKELDPDYLLGLADLGRTFGIKVWFWHVTEKYSTASTDRLCAWPFERAYVSSDLRIVPCCFIGNPEVYELARGQSLQDGWNGAEYAAFRQAHLDGRIPQVCQSCYRQREPTAQVSQKSDNAAA